MFCLFESSAGAVMVGSAGTKASESELQANAERREMGSRPSMVGRVEELTMGVPKAWRRGRLAVK